MHYCHSPVTALRRMQGSTLARHALLRSQGATNLVSVATEDWYAFKHRAAGGGASNSNNDGDDGEGSNAIPSSSVRPLEKRSGSVAEDAGGEHWKEQAKSWLKGLLDALVEPPASPHASEPLTSSASTSSAAGASCVAPDRPGAVVEQEDQENSSMASSADAGGSALSQAAESCLSLGSNDDVGVSVGGPGCPAMEVDSAVDASTLKVDLHASADAEPLACTA
jgi:hypothetical protein